MLNIITERALPTGTFDPVGQRPFGVYVHVPWCTSRCGYCDFNTYVPGSVAGATPTDYVDAVLTEIQLAAAQCPPPEGAQTVFFGGGTPTLIGASALTRILREIQDNLGLAEDAEITTEANPESVTPGMLEELREAGFNRISIGMQSAVPHVLQILDRVHTPGAAVRTAQAARAAGFEEISLDLIYGTPGESDDDWRRSVETALSAEPSHVSAYSLIIEPNTRMARMAQRGEVQETNEDVLAQRYELADELLTAAGLQWYEVSNWARGESSACRHNVLYWHSDDWLGFGPGAHSHVAGTRWWNLKHPRSYGEVITEKSLPMADFELVDAAAQRVESIMLRLRLAEGIALAEIGPAQQQVPKLISDGLLQAADNRVVLTDRGRLLADFVIRQLAFPD